jgi:hypothetical protein
MKINLSGENVSMGRCQSAVMSGRLTDKEIEYIINHGPYPPEVMREYMSGWFSDVAKSVGSAVSTTAKSIGSTVSSAAKSVGSFGQSMVSTWNKAPLPVKVVSLLPGMLPATLATTAVKAAVTPYIQAKAQQTAINKAGITQAQQVQAVRETELARLEAERIALLKRQDEEKAALAAATAQAQTVAVPATATTSTSNIGKILAIGSLALIPLLFGQS